MRNTMYNERGRSRGGVVRLDEPIGHMIHELRPESGLWWRNKMYNEKQNV
jgi:hypothetical protein